MSKELKIAPYPDKPKEYVQGIDRYIMGIDEGGYDGKTFAVCVADRQERTIKYLYSYRDEDFYRREVERLTKYYQIPESCILKEVNK